MTEDTHKKTPFDIGCRGQSGVISDTRLLEEFMSDIDDTALRVRSAKRAIETMGLTIEQAEKVFGVRLSP